MTRPISSIFLALALAACSVSEEYVKPQSAIPDTWQSSPPTQAWPTPEWWFGFGSSRLNDLLRQGEQANFDLAAATAKVHQADAQLAIAGASLLPSLSAQASQNRAKTAKTASTAFSGQSSYYSTSTATLSASYEIDFWGKNSAAVDAAQAAADASRFDLQTARLTVQSSIATTYFDLLVQQERLHLTEDAITASEQILQALKDRQSFGIANALDVAQQENVVANQRVARPPIQQQIHQDFVSLAILTGKMPAELALVPEHLTDLQLPALYPGLPSELLDRRPDVQGAEALLRAANADIVAAKAAWFPSISLTGQGGFQSLDLSRMMSVQSLAWSVASSATQTLFDGGKISATIDLNRQKFEELSQTYRKAVASAFADVENALVALDKSGEEEQAQLVSESTAHNAFVIAQDQMKGGIIDITSVLNTQKAWFSAQDSLVQARQAHMNALVGLYKALGGGWTLDTPPLSRPTTH